MSYEPHQETPLASRGHFDDNNERFRFWCCHVRTWALVIGILEIIGSFIDIIWTIASYVLGGDRDIYGSNTVGGLVWGIIEFIIWITVASLLIYGVKKEKPLLLIPHLVWQVLSIIGSIIVAIVLFVAAAAYSGRRDGTGRQEVVGISAGAGVVSLISAAIEALFLYAVFRCYRYLKEKALAHEAASYVPMASSYAAIEKGT